jgi:Acetyltransferases
MRKVSDESNGVAASVGLRQAGIGDLDALCALETLFPGDRMSRRSLRRLLQAPGAIIEIAERGDAVLGSLVLLRRRGSRLARIYSLVVAPAARGAGLGRRLVQAAEERARAAGSREMRLEVRVDNVAARALYASLGYREVQRLPAYYEDGAEGLRLRRPLEEASGR